MGPQTARKRTAPQIVKNSQSALAALFDVDGVIADTARLHTAAWARLANEEGLPFPSELADQLRGVSREESLRLILGERSIRESDFGEMLSRKNGYYLSMIEELTADDLLPGAWHVIRELKSLGLKVAAVSASRNARRVLERLEVLPILDLVVDGNDQDTASPARSRFLIAAHRLGSIPRSCIVFEDSPTAIQHAKEAGMKTVALASAAQSADPDLHFESFRGVDARLVLKWLHSNPPGAVAKSPDPLAMAGAI